MQYLYACLLKLAENLPILRVSLLRKRMGQRPDMAGRSVAARGKAVSEVVGVWGSSSSAPELAWSVSLSC